MTSTTLKEYFRQFIKVVAGGPASGPEGTTRGQGLLNSFDKLVDESERAFVPLTTGELGADRQALAALALRPLLLELANSPAAGGTEGFGGLGDDLAIASGTVAWNAGGRYQDFRSLTLTANAVLQLPANVPPGGSGFLRVFQNFQGGYTLAAPAGATSQVPPGFGVNSTASKLVALVGYVFDGTHFYWNVTRYN